MSPGSLCTLSLVRKAVGPKGNFNSVYWVKGSPGRRVIQRAEPMSDGRTGVHLG